VSRLGAGNPLDRLAPVVRLAPAKINLTLAVLGRRPDGYHALHSVVARVDCFDRLSLAPTTGARDSLVVVGADCGPLDDNLVLRAIAAARSAVRAHLPTPPVALACRLEKAIPVAAGLGGGSSDAAAAIDGALEAWGIDLAEDERLAIGAAVGSDVPLFLAASPALVEGRGERVRPLRGVVGADPGVLLVTPPLRLATADVFAALASGPRPSGAAALASRHFVEELERGLDGVGLLARAGVLAAANDLVPAATAVVPALAGFRAALRRLLGRPVGQAGSGPTAWVLYPSTDEAAAAAALVRAAVADGRIPVPGTGSCFVAAAALRVGAGSGPAPGADDVGAGRGAG
jgi:4-diphosphocytidyl-2-C-methyl-D-erythritol kinase